LVVICITGNWKAAPNEAQLSSPTGQKAGNGLNLQGSQVCEKIWIDRQLWRIANPDENATEPGESRYPERMTGFFLAIAVPPGEW
jgi:hypothetical protein